MRKFATFNASHELATLGLDSNSMPVDLKLKLITIYCRPALLYGVADCKLSEQDVNELQSIEARILKKSLGLSKYCKTQPLLDALKVRSIEDTIKERKTSFLLQLMNNELTLSIINAQIKNYNILDKNSFTHKMVNEVLGIQLKHFDYIMM